MWKSSTCASAASAANRALSFQVKKGGTVRCITFPVNKGSIAFHTHMGFEIEGVTGECQGVPCAIDHELNGEHRVLFVRSLS